MSVASAWPLVPVQLLAPLLALLLAMALLALAQERHHQDLLGRAPSPRLQRRLRRVAVALLALCALTAQLSPQPGRAWVQLLVAASCAALVVALAITALGRRRR